MACNFLTAGVYEPRRWSDLDTFCTIHGIWLSTEYITHKDDGKVYVHNEARMGIDGETIWTSVDKFPPTDDYILSNLKSILRDDKIKKILNDTRRD